MNESYRFTDRLKKVIANAKELSTNRKDFTVGPEHLFVSIGNDGGVANVMFENLDVDLPSLQKKLKDSDFKADPPGSEPPFSDLAVEVFKRAKQIANEVNHNYQGDEHLVLALLAVDSPVLDFLTRERLNYQEFHDEMLNVLGHGL